MTSDMISAPQLERKLIPNEEWDKAPKVARDLAVEEADYGTPTGIAFDEKAGWFVIQTGGQGPYVIWSEKAQ